MDKSASSPASMRYSPGSIPREAIHVPGTQVEAEAPEGFRQARSGFGRIG
jgi:hypothetical protein